MQKIAVRTKTVRGISSNIIMFSEDEDSSFRQILTKYGIENTLLNCFDEKDYTYHDLKEEYAAFLETGKSNLFTWIYKIDSQFGIGINGHIELYYFESLSTQDDYNILEWQYASGKKYLGDTWWFEDNEILEDVQKLSIIEFYRKYKG